MSLKQSVQTHAHHASDSGGKKHIAQLHPLPQKKCLGEPKSSDLDTACYSYVSRLASDMKPKSPRNSCKKMPFPAVIRSFLWQ